MSVRAVLKRFVRAVRNYGRKVGEGRVDLADSVPSENVLAPIPPEKPPGDERRRGSF
jgi:hypothetical protein